MLVCAGAASAVHAQPAGVPGPGAGSPALSARCETGVVPALTVIRLKTVAPLGSRVNKTGEMFPMRLAEPVMLGDCVAIPADSAAEGEVIQAKKSGLMGAGGEFVAAARWLEIDGRRVRLRSLKMAKVGADDIDDGGAASGAGVPFPHIFGKAKYEVDYPAGTVVEAKLAEAFDAGPGGSAGQPAAAGSAAEGATP